LARVYCSSTGNLPFNSISNGVLGPENHSLLFNLLFLRLKHFLYRLNWTNLPFKPLTMRQRAGSDVAFTSASFLADPRPDCSQITDYNIQKSGCNEVYFNNYTATFRGTEITRYAIYSCFVMLHFWLSLVCQLPRNKRFKI